MTPEAFTEMDTKGRCVRAAHEYIFTELPKEVPDVYGRLIRSTDSAQVRWLSWQKSIQQASRTSGKVPPDVMDYFQKTKQYMKPPEAAEVAQRFTWSPSKLMTFETCPMKFAAESFYKTVPYTETTQSIWGTRVHKAAEDYFNGRVPETEAYEVVKSWCFLLDRLPGDRLVEHKIALTSDWKPAVWDSGEESLRCILDLGFKHGKTLKCYDWKTGKVKDDPIQMQIYCYALAILFPDVEDFDFRYIWLKEKRTTGFQLKRSELLPIAKDVRARVARMKEACDNENFPMRKSGLCRQYCGATECAYCGGRR